MMKRAGWKEISSEKSWMYGEEVSFVKPWMNADSLD